MGRIGAALVSATAAALAVAWLGLREEDAKRAPPVPSAEEPGASAEPRDPPAPAALAAARSSPAGEREVVSSSTAESSTGILTGRVLGPDGEPLARASVLFAWTDAGGFETKSARTRADGRFEIDVGDPRARGDLLATVDEHVLAPAALLGVSAGASDVELRLGPPAFFTLEARDGDGRLLRCRRTVFWWCLGGGHVGDDALRVDSEEPRWARSPVPFVVDTRVAEADGGRFGPFDPADVGERLVLTLERLPLVRGRVTHAGRPVAEVAVELVEAGGGEGPGGARTHGAGGWSDERGEFELFHSASGSYSLRAFQPPHGGGSVGPLELDGRTDVVDVELALDTPPGSIEGRVAFPTGHAPDEVWLSVSGAAGYRALRPDGSFTLPDLPAGAQRVRVLASTSTSNPEFARGERWIRRTHGPRGAPRWLDHERAYDVDVPSGGVARLVLDLAAPMPCRIEGEARVDGAAPRLSMPRSTFVGEFDRPVVSLHRGEQREYVSAAWPDERGRFVVGASEPGEHRLTLELDLRGGGRWLVRDRVSLARGTVGWTLDVASGSLALVPADGARPLREQPTVRWSGPGALTIDVDRPASDDERGSLLHRRVPAGRVRIESGEAVVECDVRAGETTEVRWPPQ